MRFIIKKIRTLINIITSIIYKLFLNSRREITIGNGVYFNRIPYIDVIKNCRLIIGNNVVINSSNRGYHINMHSKCKILLDREGAVVEIGANTRIHGTCIHAYKRIIIGKNCLIAANTQIFDGNGHDLSLDAPENRINTIGKAKDIEIGDNVWIGANCIVLPGSVIGEGSVIAANSVVQGTIPARCLAGGNPIMVLKDESI